MKNLSLNEYTLWLESESEKYTRLKNIIVDFSTEAQSPLFEPHVTLLGGISIAMTVEKIIEKMKTLTEKKRTITLSLTATHSSDSYYQSIFLECKKTKVLASLNHKAQKLFSQTGEYNPHLSLLYSNISQTKKNLLLKKISHKIVLPLNFVVDKISLWKALGLAERWQKIYDIFW